MPCDFVITGFGPFHGVDANPTQCLIERLERYKDDEQQNRKPGFLHRVNTRVLPVVAHAVKDWLQQEVFPGLQDTQQLVVLVHLGVDSKACGLRLEWQAYNDATFRVPDEEGYQPQHEPIEHSAECPLGSRLVTRLPLNSLLRALKRRGYPVHASFDAGRFVCNYTYFVSLLHCKHRLRPPPAEGAGPERDLISGSIIGGSCEAAAPGSDQPQQQQQEQQQQEQQQQEQQGGDRGDSWQLVPPPAEACDAGSTADGLQQAQQQAQQHPEGWEAPLGSSPAAAAADGDKTGDGRGSSREGNGNSSSSSGGGGGLARRRHPPLYSLFVHVPPFSVVPERVQFEFLLDLLRELARCVALGDEAGEDEGVEEQVVAGSVAAQQQQQDGGRREAAEGAAVVAADGDVVVVEREDAAAAAVCAVESAGLQGERQQRGVQWQWLLSCKMQ